MKKYLILVMSCFVVVVGAAHGYELGDVSIHGFVSQGYLQSDRYNYLAQTDDGSFEFNELGLNFTTQLTDDLRVGAQLFAQDLGDTGNDEITLDWAYGDYRFHNMLGLRAGKVKIAHGLYNETRDIDAVRTFIFLPRAIYDPATRDTFAGMKGVNVYGELPAGFSYHATVGVVPAVKGGAINEGLSEFAKFEAQDTVKNGIQAMLMANGVPASVAAGIAADYTSKTTFESEILDTHTKNTRNLALRWAPTFVDGLRLSYTYFASEVEIDLNLNIQPPTGYPNIPDQDADSQTLTIDMDEVGANVFSLEYMRGNLMLAGEYNMIKVDLADADTVDLLGWSVMGSYRFTDWLELGAYYSDYNTNTDDRDGEQNEARGLPAAERYLKDACLAARFDINEYWIFKLEGHAMRGLDEVDWRSSDPAGPPRIDWFLFAGKITYNF